MLKNTLSRFKKKFIVRRYVWGLPLPPILAESVTLEVYIFVMHILTLHKCPFSFLSSCSSIFFRNCTISNSSMKANEYLYASCRRQKIFVIVELKNDRHIKVTVNLLTSATHLIYIYAFREFCHPVRYCLHSIKYI